MKTQKILVLLILILMAFGFFFFDLQSHFQLANLKVRKDEIVALWQASPFWFVCFYFAAYVLMAALSLPGAALLTLLGGAIFGLFYGTVIVSFASSLGATLSFLVSRFLLRDTVIRRFGDRLASIEAGIAKEGAFYLFTLRLIPIFPFFLINLLFGLTRMKTWQFYLVSQLGMLAGTVVYVNAGTELSQLTSLSGILSPAVILSFALLGIFPILARRVVESIARHKIYRGWKKPARFDCNLIVIGGGSAGLVSAYIAAAVKAKVTLIEKHKLGGDCLNTGCVPSKALIRSAKFFSHIKRSAEFGVTKASAEVDFAAIMQRVERVIQAIEPHDSAARYRSLGVDVVEANATLIDPWTVEITDAEGAISRLTAQSFILATGARPLVPPIPGLEGMDYLTSDTVWQLRVLPLRLLVLGGGPIGCELAQAFARLGSKVSLVEMAPRLMSREDADVADLVTERFKEEGIVVLTGHRASAFQIENGEKILLAEYEGEIQQIAFDVVLVALGRVANLKGYGLEKLKISVSRTIDTNAFLQTTFPNIYAAGDVAGPYQFTHTAAHQAWYAAVNALFDPFKKLKVDYRVIPWATFTDPEVARVGINEQEAKEKGIPYEVTHYGIDDLDRAIAESEAHGFIKVLTVPGKDKILGVTIVGCHAGDLIAEYVLAMKHGIGLNKILGTIHIYPTLAEANKYVAGNWKRAHAPQKLLAFVAAFHRWRLK